MERNAGYEIKRLILYDDNKGFVLGENLRAPDPYVTWKITEGQGRRSYDWGHYFPIADGRSGVGRGTKRGLSGCVPLILRKENRHVRG